MLKTLNFQGKELTLIDQAYVTQMGDTIFEREMLNAPAVDSQGNEYVVYWEIINNEQNASVNCDWNNPVKVEKL